MNGRYYEFTHPDFDIGPGASKEQLGEMAKAVEDSFAWLATGGPYDDWAKAETLLHKL
jgi:hypothetical protein